MIKNDIPKVSVIMTVLNSEKYLKESINSVLKQSLKDLELVIIDGKSSDGTLSIIDDYMKNDKRIKLYYQDGKGIGNAKNCGIKNSIGEFITFLDSDDLYADDTILEKLYNAAKEHDVNVCGGLRSILHENGRVTEHSLHRAFLVGFPNGRLFNYKYTQYDYHFHSYIYDRKMVMDSNALFNETTVYDDTHFTIRVMLAAELFYVIPVEMYRYRLHGSYSWSLEKCREAMMSLIDQLKFTSQNNLDLCHYYTVQRINYEYGPLFESYLKEGHYDFLNLYIEAQRNINSSLIDIALKRHINTCLIDGMNFPNGELFYTYISGEKKIYILTYLYKLCNNFNISYHQNDYPFTVEDVYHSITFRTGNVVLWLPKKIAKLLKIKK